MRRLSLLVVFTLLVALVIGPTVAASPHKRSDAGTTSKSDCPKNPDQNRPKKSDTRCLADSGAGVARADFNGDGFSDEAVGVPLEDLGSASAPIPDAGAVDVVYGSSQGLTATGAQFLTQVVTRVGGDPPEAGDRFGSALAAGDFNGDGFADLAVGIPFEDVVSVLDAGEVNVFFGSPSGLVTPAAQIVTQDSSIGGVPIADSAETGDLFGSALTWGDFNHDGDEDLAIGVPGESVITFSGILVNRAGAGAVNVLYSSSSGLIGAGNQFFTQDSGNIPDSVEVGDHFGAALTAARIECCDVADDLVVGVPGEDVGTIADAGAVNTIASSNNAGLDATQATRFWTQDSVLGNIPVADQAEAGDQFGAVLTTGDFNGDGTRDLAVGVPFEDIFSLAADMNLADAGAVNILYQSFGGGLITSGNQFVTQGDFSFDPTEAGDEFGAALAANNLNQDTNTNAVGTFAVDDLVVGAPLEDLFDPSTGTPQADAGIVNFVFGSSSGLVTTFRGVEETFGDGIEAGDRFGASVAVWNFNGADSPDVAVGIPGEDLGPFEGGIPDAGELYVAYYNVVNGDLNAAGIGTLTQMDIPGTAEKGDQMGSDLY
ncbi:MAG: integrin alpha [Actinomycetota bacterium]|nr:integrin alpha [Actinomycetota bacterium]